MSAYLPLLFPRDRDRFDAFYTFGEGASPADFRLWRDSWMWFLKKVTLRWGGTRPLLIKSPVHTARVALLLRLFPRARFVYVHRDPLVTFQSSAHLADKYYPFCYLQRPTDAAVTDFILDQFDLLHSTYMADRPLIPPGARRRARRLARLLRARLAPPAPADALRPPRATQAGLWRCGLPSWTPTLSGRCAASTTAWACRASRPCALRLSATAAAWSSPASRRTRTGVGGQGEGCWSAQAATHGLAARASRCVRRRCRRPLSRQLRQRVRQRWGNFYRGFGYAELLAAEEREDREAAQAEAQRDA